MNHISKQTKLSLECENDEKNYEIDKRKSTLVAILTGGSIISVIFCTVYYITATFNEGFFSFYNVPTDFIGISYDDMLSIGILLVIFLAAFCIIVMFSLYVSSITLSSRKKIELHKEEYVFNRLKDGFFLFLQNISDVFWTVILIFNVVLMLKLEPRAKKLILFQETDELIPIIITFLIMLFTLIAVIHYFWNIRLRIVAIIATTLLCMSIYYGISSIMYTFGRTTAIETKEYYLSENLPDYALVSIMKNGESYLMVYYDKENEIFTGDCKLCNKEELGVLYKVNLKDIK